MFRLADGSILVNELGSKSLLRVSGEHGKERTPILGGLEGPVGLAAGPNGSVYLTEAFSGQVSRVEANGERTVVAKDLKSIAVAPDGNLVVAEVGARRIILVDPQKGTVTEVVRVRLDVVVGVRVGHSPSPFRTSARFFSPVMSSNASRFDTRNWSVSRSRAATPPA